MIRTITEIINIQNSLDRERLALSVLERLRGHIYEDKLSAMLINRYKEEQECEDSSMSNTEILDMYCEIYGFEDLIEELRERMEEEYENQQALC